MATLMQASNQWASRPVDERYTSLDDMLNRANLLKNRSGTINVPANKLAVIPLVDADATEATKALQLVGPSGNGAAMSNWMFAQLTAKLGAPKGYLSTLPASLAADCINVGLRDSDDDYGLLMTQEGTKAAPLLTARALTSVGYKRIWNRDIIEPLTQRFGDGISGDWKVPGEFGVDAPVTKDNTTLYMSDRDMFVFLADEKNRLELPNRRDGKTGSLARGFFVSNSETGAAALTVTFFLFDYVCCNRIVWGATDVKSVHIRHTEKAGERWIEQVAPTLAAYSKSSAVASIEHLRLAQSTVIDTDHDKVLDFLTDKFGTAKLAKAINAQHLKEEDRPIVSMWDAVTGATAFAKTIEYQDDRIAMERTAGKLLSLVH